MYLELCVFNLNTLKAGRKRGLKKKMGRGGKFVAEIGRLKVWFVGEGRRGCRWGGKMEKIPARIKLSDDGVWLPLPEWRPAIRPWSRGVEPRVQQ